MAKVFYELDEAAQRLGKDVGDVRAMAERNEIDEYRDGDRILYKVEQIDLLAGDAPGDAGDTGTLALSDTSGGTGLGLDMDDDDGFGLSDSAGGLSLTDSSAGAETIDAGGGMDEGITVLDDATEGGADAAADTMITDEPSLDNVSLESFGSGSGLMDLTRESDDTSLGADGLLDELYSGGAADAGPLESETATAAGADLFDGAASAEEDVDTGAAVPMAAMAAEPYDGRGSGLAGGMAFGVTLALLGALAVLIGAMVGPVPDFLQTLAVGGMGMLVPMGALLGLTVVLGLLGFALGGRK